MPDAVNMGSFLRFRLRPFTVLSELAAAKDPLVSLGGAPEVYVATEASTAYRVLSGSMKKFRRWSHTSDIAAIFGSGLGYDFAMLEARIVIRYLLKWRLRKCDKTPDLHFKPLLILWDPRGIWVDFRKN